MLESSPWSAFSHRKNPAQARFGDRAERFRRRERQQGRSESLPGPFRFWRGHPATSRLPENR